MLQIPQIWQDYLAIDQSDASLTEVLTQRRNEIAQRVEDKKLKNKQAARPQKGVKPPAKRRKTANKSNDGDARAVPRRSGRSRRPTERALVSSYEASN